MIRYVIGEDSYITDLSKRGLLSFLKRRRTPPLIRFSVKIFCQGLLTLFVKNGQHSADLMKTPLMLYGPVKPQRVPK